MCPLTKSALPLLLLDLDGTLVDSIPGLVASLDQAMSPNPAFDRAEVRPMIGDGAEALLRRAAAARGMPYDTALLRRFIGDYTAHTGEHDTLFPDVAATLRGMAGTWRLAVCTNKPEGAARVLIDRLGLGGGLFAAISGGDSFAVRKPDPGHLTGTMQAAGGGPAVMVGDHANDMRAAVAAGLPGIFAAWGYGTPDMAGGAAVAAGFADVPALARGLLRPG